MAELNGQALAQSSSCSPRQRFLEVSAIAWMANKGAVTPGVSQKMEEKSHSASHPAINTIL